MAWAVCIFVVVPGRVARAWRAWMPVLDSFAPSPVRVALRASGRYEYNLPSYKYKYSHGFRSKTIA